MIGCAVRQGLPEVGHGEVGEGAIPVIAPHLIQQIQLGGVRLIEVATYPGHGLQHGEFPLMHRGRTVGLEPCDLGGSDGFARGSLLGQGMTAVKEGQRQHPAGLELGGRQMFTADPVRFVQEEGIAAPWGEVACLTLLCAAMVKAGEEAGAHQGPWNLAAAPAVQAKPDHG